MRSYYDHEAILPISRNHPWTESESDPNARYYNFVKNPELIPEVLETFRPFNPYKAIQDFYRMMTWLNSNESPFETNDCAFEGPHQTHPNEKGSLTDKDLRIAGRLMFFFRKLNRNLSQDSSVWWGKFQRYEVDESQIRTTPNKFIKNLVDDCVEELKKINPESLDDCVGVTLSRVYFENATVPDDLKFGFEVVFNFWVWGNTEHELMTNFENTVSAMFECLKRRAEKINAMTRRNKRGA